MYRYVRTGQRVHRVHVDGGRAFKVPQCNIDHGRYFQLLDEPPVGEHCAYCWLPPAEEAVAEKAAEKVPALGKSELPRSLVLIPKRLLAVLLIAVAAIPFLAGSASGVVLSPDDERGGTADGPSPSASCDVQTLEGCGDLVIIIERLIDEQLLRHLEIDHPPEVTPSSSPTTTPSSSPTSDASTTPSPTSRPSSNGSGGSSATPRPSARPTPRPTAQPAAPTPCFRPGNPQGGKDPCQWPPDDK